MTTTKTQATQVAYSWKAVLRTIVQVGVPTLLTLAAVLSVLSEGFSEYLPASVIAWLIGSGAFLVTAAGVLTKVMAIPGVNKFLENFGLAATPKETQTVTTHAHKSVFILEASNSDGVIIEGVKDAELVDGDTVIKY